MAKAETAFDLKRPERSRENIEQLYVELINAVCREVEAFASEDFEDKAYNWWLFDVHEKFNEIFEPYKQRSAAGLTICLDNQQGYLFLTVLIYILEKQCQKSKNPGANFLKLCHSFDYVQRKGENDQQFIDRVKRYCKCVLTIEEN